MRATLNKIELSADWRTLECPGTVRLRLQVMAGSGGVQYQTSQSIPPYFTGSPAELAPGLYSLDESCNAVRIRSADAAALATVNLQAVGAEEVGE